MLYVMLLRSNDFSIKIFIGISSSFGPLKYRFLVQFISFLSSLLSSKDHETGR